MHKNSSSKQENCRSKISVSCGRLYSPAIVLAVILTIVGCGDKNTDKAYRNSKEALADYAAYCTDIGKQKSANIDELIAIVHEWRTIDKAVVEAVFRDSVHTDVLANDSAYLALHDSVCGMIAVLVDSRPRSFQDYLDLRLATNTVQLDSATSCLAASVHRFHDGMDSVPTYRLGNAETVKKYETILTEVTQKGFRDKREAINFLRVEDRAFRSFLEHLPTLGDIPLTDVRDLSSVVMRNFMSLSDGGQPIMQQDEIVVLLTARNNRRLIQNAEQCVKDIKGRKVKGGEQAAAYQWMLLQPWIAFDSFSYAMLSDSQKKSMRTLAQETPSCLKQLGKTIFPINTDEMPSLLIKTAIASR